MKSAQQKQQDEVGVFLSMNRRLNGLSQGHVATTLDLKSPTFVSRIEKGKAVIPLGKIRAFAEVYGLPFFPFGRLVLYSMHPAAFALFSHILTVEPELAGTAKNCHVKNPKRRRGQIKLFDDIAKEEGVARLFDWLDSLRINAITKRLETIGKKASPELFSLYLGIHRKIVGKRHEGVLSLDEIVQRLRQSGPQLVTRIEKGKAPIPLDRIVQFQAAYEIREPDFSRLALACMQPEAYATFMDFLKYDRLYAKAAKECHVKNDDTRRMRIRTFGVRMRNEAFAEMRSFFKNNEELIPDGVWSNRMLSYDSTAGF